MSYAVDPVDELLAVETKADHDRATYRGQKLALLADLIVSELRACGRLTNPSIEDIRAAALKCGADTFYGNAAIDWPPDPRRI